MELRKTVYLGVLYVLGKWVTFDWQVINGMWDAHHGEQEMKMKQQQPHGKSDLSSCLFPCATLFLVSVARENRGVERRAMMNG